MSKEKSVGQLGEGSIYEEKKVSYYYIEDMLRMLSGRVLTIIDASISEEKQNKAIKDLVKKEIWTQINKLQYFYWGDKQGHSVKLEEKESDPL